MSSSTRPIMTAHSGRLGAAATFPYLSTTFEDLLTTDNLNLTLRRERDWAPGSRPALYCASLSCSQPLTLTATTRQNITCSACSSQTCKTCKGLAHEGSCQMDESTELVLSALNHDTFKRRPQCSEMIELTEGCNHMTCAMSRYEFCWLCSRRWSDCFSSCQD